MLGRLHDFLFPGPGRRRGRRRPDVTFADMYHVGDTTIETYFRRLLEDGVPVPTRDGGSFLDLLREDVVAAAIHLAQADARCVVPKGASFSDYFIPILTLCITSDSADVNWADEQMAYEHDGTEGVVMGVWAQASPLLLQILVAVALKHRHKGMLSALLHFNLAQLPEQNLFRLAAQASEPVFGSILGDPNFGRQAWALLVEAGWADPLPAEAPASAPAEAPASEASVSWPQPCVGRRPGRRPDPRPEPPPAPRPARRPDSDEAHRTLTDAAAQSCTSPEAARAALDALDDLARRGLDPHPYTGSLLDALVSHGTADMLAHFLPLVSRYWYDGVPPHPRWPGAASLVTKAAARTDPEGLPVLKVLVDIGAADIHHEAGVWYKAGPDDEHPEALTRSRRLPDGSCADDPPLLAAVQTGNTAAVAYLLGKGVAERRAGVLPEAIARATERQDAAMLEVLEGWKGR